MRFKPFKPLANSTLVLDRIEHLIAIRDYEAAKRLSENLRSLALEGLHYFQTYDWFMLMTVISLGYIGWMICLIVHVLQSYTALPGNFFRKGQSVYLKANSGKVVKQTKLVCNFLLLLYSKVLCSPLTGILLWMSPDGIGLYYTACGTCSSSLSCILCNDDISLGPNLL